MFKKSLVIVSALLALSLAACGDDDGGAADARPPAIDAPRPIDSGTPPMIDSGNMNPPAMGLGQVCPPTCPTDMTYTCLTLDADTTDGLCSLNCGQSNDPATAPTGGDPICAAAYTGTVGTTQCALRNPDMPPPIDWFCAVLCPTGQCPGGLVCDAQGLCIN